MLIKLRGIVLQTIRHNDTTDIVTLFTEQRGRVTLLSRGGTSRSARLRRARLYPLALVDTEVNFRENRDLQFLGETECPHPWRNLCFDPMKSAMTVFVSEFLNKILRTSEPDAPMWLYVLRSVHALDSLTRGMANFHLAFLIGMLPLAGIRPDLSTYDEGRLFDLRAGVFTDLSPMHRDILPVSEAAAIPGLMRINYRNMHLFRLNVEQRRHILSRLMRYYSIHLPLTDDIRSLPVLREIFS